jgi:hypothetical protein
MGASSAGGGASGRREEKTGSTKPKLHLKAVFHFRCRSNGLITPGFACTQHYELRSKIVATSHRDVRSQPTTDGAGSFRRSGSIIGQSEDRASVPVARIETDAIPLDGYSFCASPDDGREIIFGTRPEDVSPADHETRGPVIEPETLFIEPMGADTLGWFQYGSQRISARLPPQRARAIG